jgi:hypothetical protein
MRLRFLRRIDSRPESQRERSRSLHRSKEQLGQGNAAIQGWKPLLEMPDADWHDIVDNNLDGTANTIRAFAPKMVARRKGRIIVLSSMQAHGTKDAASYSASK